MWWAGKFTKRNFLSRNFCPTTPFGHSRSAFPPDIMSLAFFNRTKMAYESWVLQNAASVRYLENLMKGALFFLPGRYKDQEFLSELATGAVGIFGVMNDAVWIKKAKQMGKFNEEFGRTPFVFEGSKVEEIDSDDENSQSAPTPKPVPGLPEWAKHLQPGIRKDLQTIFNRMPLTLLKNSTLHFILAVTNQSELALELLGHEIEIRVSKLAIVTSSPTLSAVVSKVRGLIILSIELFKATIKLILLLRNRGRVLTTQATPTLESSLAYTTTDYHGSPLSSESRMYVRHTLDDIEECKRNATPSPANFRSSVGEILWIIRPVIYLILKNKRGTKAWSPWVYSLVIDLTASYLSRRDSLNDSENAELSRRQFLMLLYLLRSPFYEGFNSVSAGFTTTIYNKFGGKLSFVQTVWNWLAELLNVYRKRYFYISGSGSP